MIEEEVVKLFLEEGFQLSPEAIGVLKDKKRDAVVSFISGISQSDETPLVITQELVSDFLEEKKEEPEVRVKKRRFFEEIDPEIKILNDPSEHLGVQSDPESFLNYFKARYEKMSAIFKERMDLRGIVELKEARSMQEWEKAKIIGIIYEKRITEKGNIVLLIEDLSSRINLVVPKKNVEVFKVAEKLVLDEVVGVEVTVRPSNYWFASKIYRLGVSSIKTWEGPKEQINAVLISDIHAGSKMFEKEMFFRFLDWLNGNDSKKKLRSLADHTKYIVIAGDLVDGVGIYPNQEKELEIFEVAEQYEYVARMLEEIPEDMTIILAPGNHDAVRRAEPQPRIPKDIAPDLHSLNNVISLGNPNMIALHNIKTLVYHGRSLDTLLTTSPVLEMKRPEKGMIEQLKMRHLNSSYGLKTPIAPEHNDYLVIDEIPHIFHSGHVHINGNSFYKGTAIVNSGSFQSQTEYQSKLGIVPTPGRVPIIDLSKGILSLVRFS